MANFVCEVEYIVASDTTKETVWLRKFIIELGVVPSIDGPVLLYCASSSAIAQAKESKSHQRTKHILCRFHLILEIMDRGDINPQKINGKENLADPFTKAIAVKEFDDFKSKMGIRYCTDWL